MKIERIKIAELKAPDTNVRLHTEKQIKEFIRSLNQFGQTRPAVIDENNVVLIGNGMVAAMKQRGDTELDVFRKTGLSENDKKKLMMADNKIYTLGVDDYDAIDKLMEELQGDFDIPGFDEEVLQSMVSTVEEVTEQIANYGTMDDSQIQSIKEKEKVLHYNRRLHHNPMFVMMIIENRKNQQGKLRSILKIQQKVL